MYKKSFIALLSATFSSAIITGGVFAYTNNNVDKLTLLNRAVTNDSVEELKRARADIEITLGAQHSGAIINGRLYMWGNNANGQLGVGNKLDRDIPTKVDVTGEISKLALGNNFTGAVIDNKLYMWGSNSDGQLGNNDETKADKVIPGEPIQLPAVGTISQLSLGLNYSSILIDNKIYTWGNNEYGQLGLGDKIERVKPTPVVTIPVGTISQLTIGNFHSGAIINNKLYMWGRNDEGQLGLGDIKEHLVPTEVTNIPAGSITQLAIGGFHSGVVVGNVLYMWGKNEKGQIGVGDTTNQPVPKVVNITGTISQLSLGEYHSGVVADNLLYMWGGNDDGQLGTGDNAIQNAPFQVPNIPIGTISQLALGGNHSGAIIHNQLYMWGNNSKGQLGLGDKTNYNIPTILNVKSDIKIDLSDLNDSKNLRDNIVYNINKANLESLVEQSRTPLNLYPTDTYAIDNIVNVGTFETTNLGRISLQLTSYIWVTEIIFNGFKPVNETENITITQKAIPIADTTFKNLEINALVEMANTDLTGTNNVLSKWIMDNHNLIIGEANVTNTVDFPLDTKITQVDNFKVVSGIEGTLSFNIYVDKYYKTSGADLILSTPADPVIKLTNKVSLTGFKKTQPSEIVQIEVLKPNINGLNLLYKRFGYVDDATPITSAGIVELKKFLDLSSFPNDLVIKLIAPAIDETTLSFKLDVDKYYDENGILQKVDKTFDQLVTIQHLWSSESLPKLVLDFNKIPPNFILTYLEYNSVSGAVNKTKLEEYFDLSSFPDDAVFTLDNVSQTKNSLTVSIVASTWYNINAIKQTNPRTYDPITLNDLPENPTTDIKLKKLYDKNILAGDLAKAFKLSATNSGTFDKIIVEQYVDFLAVEPLATYTIKDLTNVNGVLSFFIVASQAYDDGLIVNNKDFKIEIPYLITIKDSSQEDFKKKNINGNGEILSKQIQEQLKAGAVITPSSPEYKLLNQLVNVSVYPPNTNFTIDNIVMNGSGVFATFEINYTASSYYENNTTVDKTKSGVINIDNLRYIPTNVITKAKFPKDVGVSTFFSYIKYNETSGVFNINMLEQFVTLNGFNLSNIGISIKMVNTSENIDKNIISFGLEVPYYIGTDGVPVNEPKIYDVLIDLTNDDILWIIIGSSIGGGILLAIILTAIIVLIKNKKNNPSIKKYNENEDNDEYEE